ncbi:MAG: hypothetical protein EHM72_15710, partial [Calditrichaeota bacterium]
VTVREGQGPRDLAQEVLGEPDLWKEILKSNQLTSPSDLRPGMKLVIPVGAIKRSAIDVENARREIQTATDLGARLFAAEKIAQAIALNDEAVKERKGGNWENSSRLAIEARQMAEKSHLETLEKRNTTADAVVTDRSGTVQSREAAEMLWRDLSLYSKLFENSRVRTLSNSYAEISFQDASRIRLNENSQAVIQKMRVDLLSKERDSSVKLEKGAAFALLQTNQKKKKFNLNVPGVKTEINSKNFWVQKDDEATKIANYEGEIKLYSEDETIVIEENQGSRITAGGSVGQSKDLLKSVELLQPKNNAVLSQDTLLLQWNPVPQAQRYLLQVSADYSFKNIIINNENIISDSFLAKDMKDGAYYWTVAAIDKEGFPGPTSARGFFYVFSDTENPFLYVNHPREHDIFQSDTLHIIGETEANVRLFVNGDPVSLKEGSVFHLDHSLRDGINKISVKAVDIGGNETEIVRTVIYASNPEVLVEYDASMKQIQPKTFLARGRTLDLKGKTMSLSSVSVENQLTKNVSRTFADEAGNFQMSIQDIPESLSMFLTVLTPAGYKKEDTLWVQVSKQAPQIILDQIIPTISAEEALIINGTVANAVKLTCNGAEVIVVDEKFSHTLQLTPGTNVIKLIAIDDMDNECVIEHQVIQDTTPPELLDYDIVVKSTAVDDMVEVKVKAADSSGLRRTASVDLQAGDMISSGYLRYNAASQLYEGLFKLPRGKAGGIKLKTVVLEDYYGNQQAIHPN